jgi:hypothetical protein
MSPPDILKRLSSLPQFAWMNKHRSMLRLSHLTSIIINLMKIELTRGRGHGCFGGQVIPQGWRIFTAGCNEAREGSTRSRKPPGQQWVGFRFPEKLPAGVAPDAAVRVEPVTAGQ